MEKSRSWPSAHDWKSCIPQKGIEGSNPSFSAKTSSERMGFFFYAFKKRAITNRLFPCLARKKISLMFRTNAYRFQAQYHKVNSPAVSSPRENGDLFINKNLAG